MQNTWPVSNKKFDEHVNDASVHVTSAEKSLWNSRSVYAIPDTTRSVRIGVNDFSHSTGNWIYDNRETIVSGAIGFAEPEVSKVPQPIYEGNTELDGVVLQAYKDTTFTEELPNGVPFVLEILQPCFIAMCQIDTANRDDDTDYGVVVGTSREGVCAYRYLYSSTYSFTKNLASMNTGLTAAGYEPLEECKDIYLNCQFSPQAGVRWIPLMPGTWVRPGVFGGNSSENIQYWTAVICPFYGYDGDPVVAKRHLFVTRYEESGYNSLADMRFGRQIDSYELLEYKDLGNKRDWVVTGTGSHKLSVVSVTKYGSNSTWYPYPLAQLLNVEVPTKSANA